jgi:Protein of unknown function (DUF4235)
MDRLYPAMKIFYKPFGIVSGIIGAKLGQRVFRRLWSRIDPDVPPDPTAGDAPLVKVVAAASLEAATMAAIGAVVDRASARFFHHLFGLWPGKSRRDKAAAEAS